MPAVTSRDKPRLLPLLTSSQINRHHQNSTSAGGKGLSNDAQIRVIGPMEPEICTKMLKKLSEKLSKISCHYTWWLLMLKIARIDDASLKVF